MAIAVRAVRSAWVNNTNTVTIALPTGTAAGDTLLVLSGHGYQNNTPTPATFDMSFQTNIGFYNGGTWLKIPVQASDVTAGNVTMTFGGSYYGHIVLIAFTGAITGVSAKVSGSSTGGAGSRTLTTSAAPATNEYAVYFGAGRANGAITSTAGTSLASDAQNQSSFVVAGEVLASGGAKSSTFNYSVVPTGEFQAIIVLSETVGPYAQEMEIANEVLYSGTPYAQEMEIAAEVLRGANAYGQVMEIAVEVLRSVTQIVRRRPVYIEL
jgi:hypothetical protein